MFRESNAIGGGGGVVIIPRPPVAPLRLAGKTNSQLIVLINKSLLGFPMRPRGQGWNVHRGQLLCIKKCSSQTRKPHAARCPAAAAGPGPARPAQHRGWRSVPGAGRVTRVTQGERESCPLRPPAASGILSAERAVECQE